MIQKDDVKKKNILIVHNYYQIPGGEDTVVANEKKMLEDYGHQVFFYSRNNSELNYLKWYQKLIFPFTLIFNIKTYQDVKRIIIQNKIDIVHVHNTLSLISPSVYYSAQKCRVPIVQTIHNFRLLCPAATFYRDGHICEECVNHGLLCAVKHNCYRDSKLQTLACVISTKIHRMTGIYGRIDYICLTEFNKKKLLRLKKINPKRVFIKPNFSDVDLCDMIPLDERKNQFVFAGRLDKLKGIDLLLKAWKHVENSINGRTDPIQLIICGKGPLADWCHTFIKDNGLANVEMKGFVTNEEVRKIIGESKALIIPTQWYEGFPMTIAEAYSVGTPVIGSDIGNVGNLILNNQYKFKHDSITSLVQCILRFSNINCEMNELVYETKTENYKKLIDIYQSCIDMQQK